ncbi:MAG TPA: DUF3047 domain-containing protein [Burkholderiaceae bacterium]|nr:DUF3047 domain-containing protein [Burkholderiaceae bacterium]
MHATTHSLSSFCLGAAALAVALSMGAARAADCQPRDLPALGDANAWKHGPLSKLKRDTQYRIESDSGQSVLHAIADSSASAWVHLKRTDIAATPMLEWRWRTPALIVGAANEDPKREDAPVRVIIGFDGDKSKLPEKEQRYFERIKRLTGRDMPYAMLMYIWDNRNPVDMVVPSAHTSRIKMIVVESGSAGVGDWRSYRRNLAQDYERAFGERPGAVLGFGLMTDTDNTGEKAEGFYGALRLGCAGAK